MLLLEWYPSAEESEDTRPDEEAPAEAHVTEEVQVTEEVCDEVATEAQTIKFAQTLGEASKQHLNIQWNYISVMMKHHLRPTIQ